MKNVKIKLGTVNDVKAFVNSVAHCTGNFDIISGRYVVDAKSIMGIFSLDLSRPLDLRIKSNDDGVMEKISPFIAG